jgi:hypothetical protein
MKKAATYFYDRPRRVLRHALFIVLYLIVSVGVGEAGTVTVTSPQPGAVVTAGQTISVTFATTSPAGLLAASAWTVPVASDAQRQFVFKAPFAVPVKIPSTDLGPATLRVQAADKVGGKLETSFGIVIRPPAPAQSLKVRAGLIGFLRVGGKQLLDVQGVFPDGVDRYVRLYNTTYEINNPQVATVDALGLVTGVAPGMTTVTIRHGSLSTTLPVKVGVFEERGDLDGNHRIDQNDVSIVSAAIGTPPTGPGDPRDLNNDGQINATDEQQVRSLCSWPNCSTVPPL